MAYHLTVAVEDSSGKVSLLNYCSQSFREVMNYLSDAYSEYKVCAFACVRKCVKEV